MSGESKTRSSSLTSFEGLYNALMKNPQEGFCQTNLAGRILEANPAYCRLIGYSREELLTKNVRDIEAFLSASEIRDALRSVRENGSALLETRHRCKDGRLIDVRVSAVYDEGEDKVVSFFIQDISQRRHFEEALRVNEERLRQAVNLAGLGFFDHDHVSDLIEWSARFREICGFSADEPAKLSTYLEGVHTDERIRIAEAVQRAHDPAGDGRFVVEHRFLRPDGGLRWVGLRSQTFFQGKGSGRTPVRTVGVVLDVTERKRAEQALREADRRKDEFLAVLAHELRNPMAAIASAVGLLEDPQTPQSMMDFARHGLVDRVSQLSRLVDDLLDVSRIIGGKVQLEKEPVDMRLVVAHAVDASKPHIDERNHSLTVHVPESPLVVHGDSIRLEQVVCNLLVNAAKYTDPGGDIAVVAERMNNSAVIRVKDNGIGIVPSFIPKLFELFEQGEDLLHRSQVGLGIGLSLVKQLTQLHGGAVSAFSEGVGRGSEFIVELPLSHERIKSSCRKTEDAVAAPGLSILVVEDQQDTALMVSAWLTLRGHTVDVAKDGFEAMSKATAKKPDVVLLDIGLPGLNGFELAKKLRTSGLSDALLVAVTGYGREQDIEESRLAGIDHHLLKPLDYGKLQALLATARRSGR